MTDFMCRLCGVLALAALSVLQGPPATSFAASGHRLAEKQIETPSGAILQIEHISFGSLKFNNTADRETGKQIVVRLRLIKPAAGKSTYDNIDELLLSWFAVTKLSARAKFVHLQVTLGSATGVLGNKVVLFKGATYERDAELGWGDMDLARSRPVKPLPPDTLKTIPLGITNGRALSVICLASNFAPLSGGAARGVMLIASPAHQSEKEFIGDVRHLLSRDKIPCKGASRTAFFIQKTYEGLHKFKTEPGEGTQIIAIPVGDHWEFLQAVMAVHFRGDGTRAIMVRFYSEKLSKTFDQLDGVKAAARSLFDNFARDAADRYGLKTVVMLALKPFEAFQGMRARYGLIFRKKDGVWQEEKQPKK